MEENQSLRNRFLVCTFSWTSSRSDFEKIRRNGYYYVDKSGLIAELLGTTGIKVTLITRLRWFGKTLYGEEKAVWLMDYVVKVNTSILEKKKSI